MRARISRVHTWPAGPGNLLWNFIECLFGKQSCYNSVRANFTRVVLYKHYLVFVSVLIDVVIVNMYRACVFLNL